MAAMVVGVVLLAQGGVSRAVDHPVITEVFTDPDGPNDGPVGRIIINRDQEFIEIYLPSPSEFNPSSVMNPDAVRLTFYEVEGEFSSPGNGLVNYRIDLPAFDLNPANGITALPRPSSGVVVLGWVDYVGDPPTGLAGTPTSRLGLVDNGIVADGAFTFIAINGNDFLNDPLPGGGGTQNFLVPDAVSSIDGNEVRSGIIQNVSAAYLLVDRDLPGYVQLFDDQNIPAGESANPSLAAGNVLLTTCFLDGFAGNAHDRFDVTKQPYQTPTGQDIDLETTLPEGGAYSLLIPQIDRSLEHGYGRIFVDVAKTTETLATDDPVMDALMAYQTETYLGPFVPTPGFPPATTSPPRLSVADSSVQFFDVLKRTTGRPGIVCANVGGSFAMDAEATSAASTQQGITLAAGDVVVVQTGQTRIHPTVSVIVDATAIPGTSAVADVDVDASTVTANGLPATLEPMQSTVAAYRVLDPTTGLAADGVTALGATALIAVQGLPDEPGVPNEFVFTSLADFVAPNLGGLVDDERHHGLALGDPLTNLSNPVLMDAFEDDMPDLPAFFINFASPAGIGFPDLVNTILNSAEVLAGNATYDDNFNATFTAVRGVEFTINETRTTGGAFVPSERVHYSNAKGVTGRPDTGLSNVTTTRGFELALLDTNVRNNGSLESGATDDMGFIVEVGRVRGNLVTTGQFLFLSMMGGLEGADIDSLDVPPHNNQTTIIYLDLDALDSVLGCETITRLFVIDGSGSSSANIIEVFSLNVDGFCLPPSFVAQPASVNACAGDPASFSTVVSGVGPFTYQWRKDGVDLVGETADTLLIPAAAPADIGGYSVVVTSPCGTVTSTIATLAIATAPVINAHPGDLLACPGQTAQFTVVATGTAPLSYQWRKGAVDLIDGGTLSGATTSTLTISGANGADEALDYNCVVSGACAPDAFSNDASLALMDCGPVFAEGAGGRYLFATPEPGPEPIALLVTSPAEPCLSVYVQADGTLGAAPVFAMPAAWGTASIGGFEIRPSTDYHVQTETVGGVLSVASTATTWLWGDTNQNGVPNLVDAQLVVKGFQGNFINGATPESTDLVPCTPNKVVNLIDAQRVVKVFQGFNFSAMNCAAPCTN